MPDGRGFVSADLKGFGLWSDDTGKLVYLAEPIIGNAFPSRDGKFFYNFVWQEARKYSIKLRCDGKTGSFNSCPCQSGEFWGVSATECLPLTTCENYPGSTNQISQNECIC